jgi:DNA-binding transcriptional ArsR family regulator
MAASKLQRRTGRAIWSLTHPLRRRILRHLHRLGEPRGALELAAGLGEGPSQITYHLKTLASQRAIREAGPAPGGRSPLYESAIDEHSDVLALLEATEEEDEGREAA